MYYYGNSYGYGNQCCNTGGYPSGYSYGGVGYNTGGGSGYALILVLFILLIIIICSRPQHHCDNRMV